MLIITTPHAYCVSDNIRDCDRIAKKVAIIMSEEASHLGIKHKLYISKTLRSNYDLNRKEGRGIDFRVELDAKITPGDLVIDVHSYPPFGFDEPDTLMTILGDDNDKNLFKYLKSQGCDVKFLYGSYLNDIVLISKEKGARAVLIEFNEDRRRSTDEILRWECRKILSYFKKMLLG